MSGKMVQPRFAEEVIKKMEDRAMDLGYITPSGKPNLSAYVKSLVMTDLNTHGIKIYDEIKYKIDKKWFYIWLKKYMIVMR